MRPLQLTLPTGFDSWAQVLTDWRVSRAFVAARLPQCFAAEPELGAPFVSAISRAICARQLGPAPTELALAQAAVIEPTHDRTGGARYIAVRTEMEATQDRHFAGFREHGDGSFTAACCALPPTVLRLQEDFFAHRRRHTTNVEEAQRAISRAYWRTHPRHGIADDFFDDAATNSVPARIARITPAWWWRSFFTRLQARSKRHHAAEGRFLDALPSLREQARTMTLAAKIAEWSDSAAAEWGWRGVKHYRRFAEYAAAKAADTATWFDRQAAGYRTDAAIRHTLDSRLDELLATLDPHARLLAAERTSMSEHWRN